MERLKVFYYLCLILLHEINSNSFTVPFTIKSSSENTLRNNAELPMAPVKTNTEDRACITLCFGTPPQCFDLEIHGSSFYIWMFDKDYIDSDSNKKAFDRRLSKTFEKKKDLKIVMEYADDKNVYGLKSADEIYLNDGNTKLFRGNFVLAHKSDSFTDTVGLIGLGYTPKSYEEEYSFIEQLYNKKVISHKVFTQSFLGDKNGELSFGKIPSEIISDYKHYGRCRALDWIRAGKKFKNNFWQCQVDGVFFGDKYEKSKVKSLEDTNVSFFSYRDKALVPKDFFDYLETSYFKDLISQGKCEKTRKKDIDLFACKEEIAYSDGLEFTFIFGNWGMRIPFYKLFQYNKLTQQFEFILYHQDNYEKYTLGRPLVRNFMMVYDYHNSEIGFYDKDNVLYLGEGEPPKVELHDYEPEDQPVDPNPKKKDEEEGQKTKKPQEDIFRPIQDIIEKSKTKTKPVERTFFIQTLLYYFVIAVGVCVALFVLYLFIRHKRKTYFPGTEYFIKESKKFEGGSLNEMA
ncbi:MAG: A1 family peptidase [archaeon]|nr:A1 family peptidase [archaeon]